MADIVMALCSVLFMILFAFLLFIFIIFIASRFFKKHYPDFAPCVSIIIPVYNEAKNIAQCLNSIIGSDYPKEKTEIIVVDDGSSDTTVSIVKSFVGVKLLYQDHQGKSAALTHGAKAAKHDFVMAIDADTTINSSCIRSMLRPFSDKSVGATSGSSIVRNRHNMLEAFENIEYLYNNLIRASFSAFFGTGIWFFGSLSCYRKSVLEKIGFFKKDTLAEDMDTALEVKRSGFTTINVTEAIGYTVVPSTLKMLFNERRRWWTGVLQSLYKNRSLFSLSSSPAILFLFINQYWWSFYSFLSLPAIIYQVHYWLPAAGSFFDIFSYFFRWFSILGPFYVLYKLPVWGLSFYSFFGVLSGIISTFLIIASIKMFKARFDFKNLFAVFFYFPYTIVLNIIILFSILTIRSMKGKFFIR